MSRGVDLRSFGHNRLIDCGIAYILEQIPPGEHREEMRENLWAPMEGSKESRERAQLDAIAQMGLTPEDVQKFMAKKDK